jgi:hypothetical protein
MTCYVFDLEVFFPGFGPSENGMEIRLKITRRKEQQENYEYTKVAETGRHRRSSHVE